MALPLYFLCDVTVKTNWSWKNPEGRILEGFIVMTPLFLRSFTYEEDYVRSRCSAVKPVNFLGVREASYAGEDEL